MEQRSPEWFAARKGVITGSRVGAILGVNPYQSADDTMREMVREYFDAEKEFKGNEATDHGEAMEPIALEFYEYLTRNAVEQTGLVKHEKYNWIGASPDGLIGADGGLEIKCPYWAKKPYSVHEKPSYYAQCQLVMEVCDIEWMDFLCYINEETHLLERLHRSREWFTEALPKLQQFHDRYLNTIEDEAEYQKHLEQKIPLIKDKRADRFADLFDEIKEAELSIKSLKEEYENLKRELGEEFGTFQTSRIKVVQIKKRGSVDNKAIFKDVGVEELLANQGKTLEDYRKSDVVSYLVKGLE